MLTAHFFYWVQRFLRGLCNYNKMFTKINSWCGVRCINHGCFLLLGTKIPYGPVIITSKLYS
jgi:hypothetical protein